MKVLHDWLKEYIGEGMPTREECEELFTFHSFEIDGVETVEGKDVLDVKVLPDRSSDCLSHRGVAHELGALANVSLVKDVLRAPVSLLPVCHTIRITIDDSHACRRFAGARMTGVTIGPSPAWLVSRLHALGQRSINNVVDATNYVMLDLGQPLHAYDADKFPHTEKGWHFRVRMASEGEEVTTLSGDTYTLTPQIQLITDAETGNPAGIAGIKGGKLAEIDGTTTSIILEAANFDPQITRKAAQHLRLQTDASKRFENNLSPELVPYALTEVVRLITEIGGGQCEGYADVYPTPLQNVPVTVTLAQINALLGMTLDASTVEDIFVRLNFAYEITGDGAWVVTAPWERTDIMIREDVIAEIGRVYGYEHVASVLPTQVPLIEYNSHHFYSEKIRSLLVLHGYVEVITSSFRKSDIVRLQNALASDKGCLRSSLSSNIREVLDRNMPNADLLGLSSVCVFEIGTVFEKTATDVVEHRALTLGVRTKQQGYVPKDDVALLAIVAMLEGELGVPLGGTLEKGTYECDMNALIAKLPMPTAYEAYTPHDVTFVPYSSYPFIARDIALWTEEGTTATAVEEIIRTHAGELLVRLSLFDTFEKDGRVSYAFRLIFQSYEKTLTDEEVGAIMKTLTTALTAQGFEIR